MRVAEETTLKPRRKWEYNITVGLKDTELGDVGLNHLSHIERVYGLQ